jgi:hypothetical protein
MSMGSLIGTTRDMSILCASDKELYQLSASENKVVGVVDGLNEYGRGTELLGGRWHGPQRSATGSDRNTLKIQLAAEVACGWAESGPSLLLCIPVAGTLSGAKRDVSLESQPCMCRIPPCASHGPAEQRAVIS